MWEVWENIWGECGGCGVSVLGRSMRCMGEGKER